jgi:hypothetical protein
VAGTPTPIHTCSESDSARNRQESCFCKVMSWLWSNQECQRDYEGVTYAEVTPYHPSEWGSRPSHSLRAST